MIYQVLVAFITVFFIAIVLKHQKSFVLQCFEWFIELFRLFNNTRTCQ